MKPITDLHLYHEITQFYYREARMLDNREYQSWMALLAPDIEYTMPARHNVAFKPEQKNVEAMLNREQELSHALQPPLRHDSMLTLTLRANRPTNPAAWADNPPMRTVRHVSNIEVYKLGRAQWQVHNNVQMSYSRHADDNHLYSFQREDVLQRIKGELRLYRRRIITDWNVITAPTVALIL